MIDTPHTPFTLPGDYVEQTKSLRDKTANELTDVRAKIADLQRSEQRLMAQLAAMDEIVCSVSLCKSDQESPGYDDEDGADAGSGETATDRETVGVSKRKEQLSVGYPGSVANAVVASPVETSGEEVDLGATFARRMAMHTPRHASPLAGSVDAVVEILTENGPLHYRTIYEKVEEMGISVIGKDPAAVLLARFSRDPRIRRVGSGTYSIGD